MARLLPPNAERRAFEKRWPKSVVAKKTLVVTAAFSLPGAHCKKAWPSTSCDRHQTAGRTAWGTGWSWI